jgi:hypothetical protein
LVIYSKAHQWTSFFFTKSCGKNTCFVHNNSLPERHYQMCAVVNTIAMLKTASQFATVRLRASTAFYFLLLCHITKWDKQFARTSNVKLMRIRVTKKQKLLHFLSLWLQCSLSSTQNACIILSSVTCPSVPYFFTLSHKQHDFRVKNIVFSFSV